MNLIFLWRFNVTGATDIVTPHLRSSGDDNVLSEVTFPQEFKPTFPSSSPGGHIHVLGYATMEGSKGSLINEFHFPGQRRGFRTACYWVQSYQNFHHRTSRPDIRAMATRGYYPPSLRTANQPGYFGSSSIGCPACAVG